MLKYPFSAKVKVYHDGKLNRWIEDPNITILSFPFGEYTEDSSCPPTLAALAGSAFKMLLRLNLSSRTSIPVDVEMTEKENVYIVDWQDELRIRVSNWLCENIRHESKPANFLGIAMLMSKRTGFSIEARHMENLFDPLVPLKLDNMLMLVATFQIPLEVHDFKFSIQ